MRMTISDAADGATNGSVRAVSGKSAPDRLDSDADPYFRDAARRLLGPDAGYQLHIITGFNERSCYRYAAGDRDPPGYFLLTLLRSPQGGSWFAALMQDCDAEWLRDLQSEREVGAAALAIARRK